MVPSHLATSPIMTDGSALMESQMGKSVPHLIEPTPGNSIQSVGSSGENCMKKRRKRRKKSKLDSVKREDNQDSEDDDVFPIDMSSDEDAESAPSRWGTRRSSVKSWCDEQKELLRSPSVLLPYWMVDFHLVRKHWGVCVCVQQPWDSTGVCDPTWTCMKPAANSFEKPCHLTLPVYNLSEESDKKFVLGN